MAGKKGRYIYYLYNDVGELVDKGTQTEIIDRHICTGNNLYTSWKKGSKFLREYRVKREKIDWKPIKGESFWYVTGKKKPVMDHFDPDNITCLERWYAKGVYRTKEEAIAGFLDLEHKLKSYYENT